MLLNNSEIEKIQNESVKIFDEFLKNSVADISEEERDSEYNESVQKIVCLVEEIITDKGLKQGNQE